MLNISFLLTIILILFFFKVWDYVATISTGKLNQLKRLGDKKNLHIISLALKYRKKISSFIIIIILFFSLILNIIIGIYIEKILLNFNNLNIQQSKTYIIFYNITTSIITIIFVLLLVYIAAMIKYEQLNTKLLRVILPFARFGTKKQKKSKISNKTNNTKAEDEIMSLLDIANDLEIIPLEKEEQYMIKGIFNLKDTLVREIMVPRTEIKSIPIDSSIEYAIKIIHDYNFSRIPVYKNNIDNIIGIVEAKDLLIIKLNDTENSKIDNFLHKPFFIPETKNISELLKELKYQRPHIAIAIDEYGRTAGLITLHDIIEEVVGELEKEKAKIITIKENEVFLIDASIPINEINNNCNLTLSANEEVDTIGGLVCLKIDRIPKTGEEFIIDDQIKIKIIKATPKKINLLKIEKLKANYLN